MFGNKLVTFYDKEFLIYKLHEELRQLDVERNLMAYEILSAMYLYKW